MPRDLFSRLSSESFEAEIRITSTPEGIRKALNASQEVRELRAALDKGELTEASIERQVRLWLESLSAGSRFPYEIAMAALAVALERRPSAFAERFLRDASDLRLRELPMFPRVAGRCMAARQALARNENRSIVLSEVPQEGATWSTDEPAPEQPDDGEGDPVVFEFRWAG